MLSLDRHWHCFVSDSGKVFAHPIGETSLSSGAKTALIPTGAPRLSSLEENLVGELEIASPSDFDDPEMPGRIDSEVRFSWAPAHLRVTFANGRHINRTPMRRRLRHLAIWKEVDYRDRVFGGRVRGDFPLMVHTPIEVPGAPARTARATNPSLGNNEWAVNDRNGRNAWPADGWGQFTDEDWALWRRQEKKTYRSGTHPFRKSPSRP